jgi:hypothetical protein
MGNLFVKQYTSLVETKLQIKKNRKKENFVKPKIPREII